VNARRIQNAVALGAGLVFSAGLVLSGMAQPEKVIGFLDVGGRWDASLLCVMAGAVGVHFVVQRLAHRRTTPLWSPQFWLPTRQDIDGRLLLGSLVFGVGWGLSGYCPGPAIVSLPLGGLSALVFVSAMAAGMWLTSRLERVVPALGGTPAPAQLAPAQPAAPVPTSEAAARADG
jgi:uncharacterized membrane protein YedE/YeeE